MSSTSAARNYNRYHNDEEYRQHKIEAAMNAYSKHGKEKRATMRAYYYAHRAPHVAAKELFRELPNYW